MFVRTPYTGRAGVGLYPGVQQVSHDVAGVTTGEAKTEMARLPLGTWQGNLRKHSDASRGCSWRSRARSPIEAPFMQGTLA